MTLAAALAASVLPPAALQAQQQRPAIPQAAASTRAIHRGAPETPASSWVAGSLTCRPWPIRARLPSTMDSPTPGAAPSQVGWCPTARCGGAGANLAKSAPRTWSRSWGEASPLPRGTYSCSWIGGKMVGELIVNRPRRGSGAPSTIPCARCGAHPPSAPHPHEPGESFSSLAHPTHGPPEDRRLPGPLKMAWGEVESSGRLAGRLALTRPGGGGDPGPVRQTLSPAACFAKPTPDRPQATNAPSRPQQLGITRFPIPGFSQVTKLSGVGRALRLGADLEGTRRWRKSCCG